METYRISPIFHLIVLVSLALFAGLLQAAPVQIGDTPTLPVLTTIDGKTIAPAGLRGKVAVVSYFSTGCPFCMMEAPRLQKLSRENTSNLIVIGVNIDVKDPKQREKVKQWVEKYHLTHPVTTDFALLEPVLGRLKGLPMHFIFDRSGKLHRIEVGEMLEEDFENLARFASQK
jgi:thiol-disulfide isomerase/thioredoxin